jgi:hypothetical protein
MLKVLVVVKVQTFLFELRSSLPADVAQIFVITVFVVLVISELAQDVNHDTENDIDGHDVHLKVEQ